MNKVLFTIEVVFVDGEIQFWLAFPPGATTTTKVCEAIGAEVVNPKTYLSNQSCWRLSVDQFNVFMHWYQSIHIKEP